MSPQTQKGKRKKLMKI